MSPTRRQRGEGSVFQRHDHPTEVHMKAEPMNEDKAVVHNTSATCVDECEACLEIYTSHPGHNVAAFAAADRAHFRST